ncbi:MAG: acyltransferase [Novosphingobium sp.]
MMIDDCYLKANKNNLVVVRLVLASAVIFTHCYRLVHGTDDYDEFTPLLGQPISHFAVDGFFFLSGFLVYGSLIRRNDVVSFVKARFFRLWPALAMATVLTIAGGFFFSSAPVGAYVAGALRFLGVNVSLHSAAYNLAGVQCDGLPCNVNGSLWTIPWEVRCYEGLALLGLLGLARPKPMARLVLPATFAFAVIWHLTPFGRHEPNGLYFYFFRLDRLWTAFALGMAAYLLRERIPLNWWMALLLLGITIAEAQLGLQLHIGTVFIGYVVLCGGFLTARNGAVAGRWPDYSYGMYIYAYPVMLLVGGMHSFQSHWTLAVANALATLPLAALSWHLVEKPVLDWNKRRRVAVGPTSPRAPTAGDEAVAL